ncbi:MAG: spore coat associated protein CotJA [Halanaerobiaceae bacterium]
MADGSSYLQPEKRNMRLAHAYVPFQQYTDNYNPAEALNRGTLFPELYMPYRSGQERGFY